MRAPLNDISSNEVVTGKSLQNVTPLKQPPQEFASRLEPRAAPGGAGAAHSGPQSTIRVAPWTMNNNPSIVYDHRTRTFVNRDDGGTGGRDIGRPETLTGAGQFGNAITAPATIAPRSKTQTQIPRVTIPSTMPANPPANRVILPPPYQTNPAARSNLPATTVSPVRPPAVAPNTRQRPATSSAPPVNSPGQLHGNFGNATSPPTKDHR